MIMKLIFGLMVISCLITGMMVYGEQAVDNTSSQQTDSAPIQFHLKQDSTEGQAGRPAGQDLFTMLLGLGAVLVLIYGLAWLSKRFNLNMPRSGQSIKLISTFSLGSREKLVIVDVEGERLLLGVTQNGISLLQKIPGCSSDDRQTDSEFSSRLQDLLRTGVKEDG